MKTLKIPKYIYEWMVLTAHYSYKAAELNRDVMGKIVKAFGVPEGEL